MYYICILALHSSYSNTECNTNIRIYIGIIFAMFSSSKSNIAKIISVPFR